MPNPTLMQAILALINAQTEAERNRVLKNKRDVLLTDDASSRFNREATAFERLAGPIPR